jgi:hypothetical protein
MEVEMKLKALVGNLTIQTAVSSELATMKQGFQDRVYQEIMILVIGT